MLLEPRPFFTIYKKMIIDLIMMIEKMECFNGQLNSDHGISKMEKKMMIMIMIMMLIMIITIMITMIMMITGS